MRNEVVAAALASGWLLQVSPAVAQSEPPESAQRAKRARVMATGSCPGREMVVRQLEPLLTEWQLVPSGESTHITVRDQGDSFVVGVLENLRIIKDAKRDCTERARVAAVMAAVTLEAPPAPAAPAPPPVPAAAPESAPTSQPQTAFGLSVGLAAMATVSPSQGGVGPAAGGLLQVRGFLEQWSIGVSAGFTLRHELGVDAASATLVRYPLDLSLGHVLSLGVFDLEPALGVAFDVFTVSATGVDAPLTSVRADIGPRVSLMVSGAPTPLRPYGVVRGAWFPRDYELVIEPLGRVGRTPRVWFDAALGVAVDWL